MQTTKCGDVFYLEAELFDNPFVIHGGSVQAPATCSGQPSQLHCQKRKHLFVFKG